MSEIIKNKWSKLLVGVGTIGLLCITPVKLHAESMMAQIGKNLVYGLFTHPIQAEKQCQEKMAKMKARPHIIAQIHSHHITMGYMAHHTGKIGQMKNHRSGTIPSNSSSSK